MVMTPLFHLKSILDKILDQDRKGRFIGYMIEPTLDALARAIRAVVIWKGVKG